ncbi:MAG: hypothetical protein M3068_02085 [Gemmatimonadota bacterium]|nr:hypothetical protein [Gemmatimonadota bacterium]
MPALEYAAGVDVRRVTSIGQFAWRGHLYFLSSVLEGQTIGIEQVSDDRWSIAFGPLNLAYLEEAKRLLTPAVFWRYSPINLDHPSPIIPV